MSAAKQDSESLFAKAQALLGQGRLEAALDLFEALALQSPSQPEVQQQLEAVRSQLLKRYRECVGDPVLAPQLCLSLPEIMKFNLAAQTGFLLSLVDGNTTTEDLISLSGMDSFEALRTLNGLFQLGILELPQ